MADVAIRIKQRRGELQNSPHFPELPVTLCIIPRGWADGAFPLCCFGHMSINIQ